MRRVKDRPWVNFKRTFLRLVALSCCEADVIKREQDVLSIPVSREAVTIRNTIVWVPHARLDST